VGCSNSEVLGVSRDFLLIQSYLLQKGRCWNARIGLKLSASMFPPSTNSMAQTGTPTHGLMQPVELGKQTKAKSVRTDRRHRRLHVGNVWKRVLASSPRLRAGGPRDRPAGGLWEGLPDRPQVVQWEEVVLSEEQSETLESLAASNPILYRASP
jgi:hypothetical protein